MRKLYFLVLMLHLSYSAAFGQDQKVLDSLSSELKKPHTDTILVQTNLRMASLYLQALKPNESIKYSESALRLSERIKYPVGVIRSYLALANAEYDKGFYQTSYEYGLKALQVAEKNKVWRSVAGAYYHLGRVSAAVENFERAINYHQQSIQIIEKYANSEESVLEANYNLLAIIARKQKRYSDAIMYYNKVMDMATKNKRERTINTILNNVAGVYFEQKEYDKALNNFKRVLDYADKNKILRLKLIAKLNIGESYTEKREFDKAASYLYEVKYACQNNSFPELERENLEYLYKFHDYQKNSDSALYYYKLFNEISEKLLSTEAKERVKQMEKALQEKKTNEAIEILKLRNLLDSIQLLNESQRNKKLVLDSILKQKTLAFLIEEKRITEIEEQKRKIEEEKLQRENELLKKDRQLQSYYFIIGIIGLGLALLATALAFVILKTSRRRKADLTLLTQKNIEIQLISDQIASQKKEIELKNEDLKNKSLQIGQSLKAANTIQQAMLPYDSRMREICADFFAIYIPRDVVSGDFYWMAKVDGTAILAVGDCTGHGVPGAFMAMIGHAILDKIVLLQENFDPALILRDLHNEIRFAFRNQSTGEASGMDISIVSIQDFDNDLRRVVFAGAKSDFYYATPMQTDILRLRGNNAMIGGLRGLKNQFQNHVLFLQSGTVFYLCSDGYADQINSEKVRFGKVRLQKKFSEIKNLPLSEQQRELEKAFQDFKQDVDQRDDVLILGIKL